MKRKYVFIGLVIVLISLLAINGKSYAKYVSNVVWNYKLESLGFYFSSPDLGTTSITNVNNNWLGEDIYFSINNGLNDLVTTKYDINYQVVCTVLNNPSISCNLNSTNTNTYTGTLSHESRCKNNQDDKDVSLYTKSECEIEGYDWEDYLMEKAIYFNLESEDDIDSATVNIEVTSTSPYEKHLYGQFVLTKGSSNEELLLASYTDIDNEGILVISNSYNKTKCATVSFDSNKLRISSDSNMDSYKTSKDGYINSFDFVITKNDSISFNFYEKVLDDYDDLSFTLQEKTCD